MRVLVPYAASDPKSRLAPILSDDERLAFSRTMLDDVLEAVADADGAPTVLATAPIDLEHDVIVDDRPLTSAVNAAISGFSTPIAVVMADLPLLTERTVRRLLDEPGDVVIAPGRGAGTNALVSRIDGFRVDYHDGSFLKHRRIAAELDANLAVIDSHRLATDIDEPADLVEVLVHGEGRALDWLRSRGFELVVERSRLSIERTG